uniref:Hypothetical chloroplast protein RF80 n=1 Tax=uncultured prymnesiophyte C19847 TaxID=858394 RepID=D9MYK5_9EUKA|nr:hypothetical chloroplast protein RF80 [uncultured prymnesiophyte C19847]
MVLLNRSNELSFRENFFQNLPFFNKQQASLSLFKGVYSYPGKLKIKWNSLDELKNESFQTSTYDLGTDKLPFVDLTEDYLLNSSPDEQDITQINYSRQSYKDGYKAKRNSADFYRNNTKDVQNALKGIPVYVVLNGWNQMTLTKPTEGFSHNAPYLRELYPTPTFLKTRFKKQAYDFCGAFGSIGHENLNKGFFFLNYQDAQEYLRAIVQNDVDGTELVSLSVHCFGLDTAYRIMRQQQNQIDFRLVPDTKQTRKLLTRHLGTPDLIIDKTQQQIRLRRRSVNFLPYLGGELTEKFSPFSSFLQNNEYFKGVPIYIVQIRDTPRDMLRSQYFNVVTVGDNLIGKVKQLIGFGVGFGQNGIMQGSLMDVKSASPSDVRTNYVFFDKGQAARFQRKQGRKTVRYMGSRSLPFMRGIISKPKIFVHNLEDFLELWEENIVNKQIDNPQNNIFQAKDTVFIPSRTAQNELKQFPRPEGMSKEQIQQKVKNNLSLKYRTLQNFVGFFFSAM